MPGSAQAATLTPFGISTIRAAAFGQSRVKPSRVNRLMATSGLSRKHNLPLRLTSFVGRARELILVSKLLRANRLVTLTGPGGVGKTRLALRFAALQESEFRSVWFFDLARSKILFAKWPFVIH